MCTFVLISSDLLHAVIEDQLALVLVLPNRIAVPLMDSTSVSDLKNPMPSVSL